MRPPDEKAPLPKSLLTHPRLPLALGGIAILLTSPALWLGWNGDDYLHRAVLLQSDRPEIAAAFPDLPGPANLFSFRTGDHESNRRWVERGFLPWWSSPDLKLNFFRPLSALTHWLDYRLWPNSALLMHIHSLAWFGVLVIVASLLFRAIMGPTIAAGIAAFLYAIDDSHGFAVGWLANRNSLIATTFGVLTLLAHHRWRSGIQSVPDPRKNALGWALAASVCFAFSLLSGELGVGAAAYLVAYALVIERSRWQARIASTLPYMLIGGAWVATYSLLHYGARGSESYVDPIHQPLTFASTLVPRAILLLLAQWAVPPAEFHTFFSENAQWGLLGVGAAALALLAMVIVPRLRKDRLALFWLIGMLLSTLPACATRPQDRLLFFTGIGAMGILGRLFADAARDPPPRSAHGIRAALGLLLIFHGIVAPILLPLRAHAPADFGGLLERAADSLPRDAEIAAKNIILVTALDGYTSGMLAPRQLLTGSPIPKSIAYLATGVHDVEVTRSGDRSLVIRPRHGFLPVPGRATDGDLSSMLESSYIFHYLDRLFWDRSSPFHVGQRIRLAALTVEVTQIDAAGLPLEARFDFDVALDDPSLCWFVGRRGRFIPFTPPAVGETVRIPGIAPY